jgi:hypothetical protein
MAGSGVFGTDCTNSSLAWLDPGCLLENAGGDIGTAVTSALTPVWILLGIVVLLVVLIGVLPNVKHIAPALRFLA